MGRHKRNIKDFLKRFLEMMKSSRLYLWMMILSIVLLALTITLPIWRVVPLAADQPFIPLHYNIYLGVDRFGPMRDLFFLPILGFVFLLVNLGMQTYFYKREKLLTRFFAIVTPVIQLIFLLAMALIILIIL